MFVVGVRFIDWCSVLLVSFLVFFFKQKTAYEMRISDWSSDVCSSDLLADPAAPMPDWWFDTDRGGGWLGAHGSHIIDQVRDWLGEFKTLSASLPTVSAREGGAEDSYVLRFELESGVHGVLQHTAGAWGKPASFARVAGTQEIGRAHV